MPYPSSDQKEFENGLAGVTAGQTSICSLDETLRYRGYAVSDLVHCSFEEVGSCCCGVSSHSTST